MNREIQFLRDIVAIPSLSGREEAVARRAVAEMEGLGFDEAFIDSAGSAVGIRQNGRPTREIVLLGHIDTVPGDIPVRIDDGRLYGRGSVDAKGPFATFVMATAAADLPPDCRLVVIGATEEESATSKGARYAREQYRPDFCIIGEPSSWQGITLGYKGRILVDYELRQEMGHTAGPVAGPAEAAVAFWSALEGYCQEFNSQRPKLFDQILPSIRHMETTSDGLQDAAAMRFGFRLPPDYEVQALIDVAEGHKGAAQVSYRGHEPAYRTGRANPLARAFSAAIRQAGGRPQPKVKTGTSDMNVVGPIWQCPIVAYGPGDSKLDHTPHEHVDVEEYLKAIEVLTIVLQEIGGDNS